MISLERMTKSACFPGVIDPSVSSVKEAYAGSMVIPINPNSPELL